jgi:cyclomaltodextrinase
MESRNNLIRILAVVAVLFVAEALKGDGIPRKEQQTLDGDWLFKADSSDCGLAEEWFRGNCDRGGWMNVRVPDYWEHYRGYEAYDGTGWLARTFEVKDTSEPLSLFFGGVDDDAEIWINGVKVGSHAGYGESFSVPAGKALRIGVNEIVVRVVDYGGPGGIFKPIALVPDSESERLFHSKYSLVDARKSAEWVKNAILYEVYLRSFSQEGTFKALAAKVPELRKLGVTVLWLMPIHPVGKVHRKGSLGSPYSVRDYYAVNPEFGTMDDFKALIKTVHRNGLKIIIDLVANHTAWDNPMLKNHPEWYTHDSQGNIVSPNPDWTDVADLNYDRSELRKYMISMMKYWVRDIGIDGFRCDVSELVPLDFWEEAREELDALKPVMMLSEGSLPEQHVKAFDITYSWNVYDVLGRTIAGSTPATIFEELLKAESYRYPRGSLRMRFNSNHDKNAWDGPAVKTFGPRGAKATAVLVCTYPGVPLIYNGEEAGNDKKLNLFEKVVIDWSKGSDFRALYKKLDALRQEHRALREGVYHSIANSSRTKVYSFMRIQEEDAVAVVINFSNVGEHIALTMPAKSAARWCDVLTGSILHANTNQLELNLDSLGFAILIPAVEHR